MVLFFSHLCTVSELPCLMSIFCETFVSRIQYGQLLRTPRPHCASQTSSWMSDSAFIIAQQDNFLRNTVPILAHCYFLIEAFTAINLPLNTILAAFHNFEILFVSVFSFSIKLKIFYNSPCDFFIGPEDIQKCAV